MGNVVQVELTDEHIHCFLEQGFLNIGRITTDEELAWLQDVCDAIVKRKIGYTPAELTTMPIIDKGAFRALTTVFSPESIVPALKSTLFFDNARQTVSRLLEVEESHLISEWRLVCKLAHGGETSWHQDAVYRQNAMQRPLSHRGATVWMPLDLATQESGCLHYLSGSHSGEVRPHYFQEGHVIAGNVDPSPAVVCPVSAGEAMVHHCRTLHYAGPNRTGKPRRALQVICRVTNESEDE